MNTERNKMNLSHWNVAVDFTGDEASALAVGLDPSQPSYVRTIGEPLFQRMKGSYQKRKGWLEWDMSPWEDGPIEKPDMLESVKLRWWASQVEPGTWNDYCQWTKDYAESGFETQRFTRQELARWLVAIGHTSVFPFGEMQHVATTVNSNEKEIDPLDLPPELDYANQAFRAVTNGYGDQAATFKNRLIDYLQSTFNGLTPEAVKRIATLSNPDKTPGRKNHKE